MAGTTPTGHLSVTTIARRPDLLPVVSDWLWREWWRPRGRTLEETMAAYAACRAEVGPPQTFVLLSNGVPVGTATLARTDLEERPDLTPWLAGVFVVPEARGRGHVRHLLAAFDGACMAASIETVAETVQRPGKAPTTLMRRDLSGEDPPGS